LILDDVYVPMRVVLDGWRVGFTERARATDVRRFAPRQEYRRKVRTLTGVIQLCAWLPAVLVPLRNPIWLQFVMHKLLRLLTPYLVIGMGVGALGWLSAQMDWRSHGLAALAAAGLFGALIAAVPRARRIVKTQVRWMWALQSSVVAATINGLRGRWDVWQS